jgi:hypothetical protein
LPLGFQPRERIGGIRVAGVGGLPVPAHGLLHSPQVLEQDPEMAVKLLQLSVMVAVGAPTAIAAHLLPDLHGVGVQLCTARMRRGSDLLRQLVGATGIEPVTSAV